MNQLQCDIPGLDLPITADAAHPHQSTHGSGRDATIPTGHQLRPTCKWSRCSSFDIGFAKASADKHTARNTCTYPEENAWGIFGLCINHMESWRTAYHDKQTLTLLLQPAISDTLLQIHMSHLKNRETSERNATYRQVKTVLKHVDMLVWRPFKMDRFRFWIIIPRWPRWPLWSLRCQQAFDKVAFLGAALTSALRHFGWVHGLQHPWFPLKKLDQTGQL